MNLHRLSSTIPTVPVCSVVFQVAQLETEKCRFRVQTLTSNQYKSPSRAAPQSEKAATDNLDPSLRKRFYNGGTWPRTGSIPSFCSPGTAQHKVKRYSFRGVIAAMARQASSVDKVHYEEWLGLWSEVRMCFARSALLSPLYLQTVDQCGLNAALLWRASQHPPLCNLNKSVTLLSASWLAALRTCVAKEISCQGWKLCGSPSFEP